MNAHWMKLKIPASDDIYPLVCDSATLESLFRSNWPLRRSEAALNLEPISLGYFNLCSYLVSLSTKKSKIEYMLSAPPLKVDHYGTVNENGGLNHVSHGIRP
jgi:hypothetical protein